MSTLAEIKAAADSLPSEQKEELLRYLAERLRGNPTVLQPSRLAQSRRGFPISRGRERFTSVDVAKIELEAELSR